MKRYSIKTYEKAKIGDFSMLSNKEIIEVIQDYIEEDKYKSAILINGRWGSGKTFFIKEEISKVIIENIKNNGKYIYVSLYGVGNIEEISNKLYSEICSDMLVKLSGIEKEKIDEGIKLIPKLSPFTKFIPFIKNYKSIKKIVAPIIKEIVKIKYISTGKTFSVILTILLAGIFFKDNIQIQANTGLGEDEVFYFGAIIGFEGYRKFCEIFRKVTNRDRANIYFLKEENESYNI